MRIIYGNFPFTSRPPYEWTGLLKVTSHHPGVYLNIRNKRWYQNLLRLWQFHYWRRKWWWYLFRFIIYFGRWTVTRNSFGCVQMNDYIIVVSANMVLVSWRSSADKKKQWHKQDIQFDSHHTISRTLCGRVDERGMMGLYPGPVFWELKMDGYVVFWFRFWSLSVAVTAVVILQQNSPWDGIMLIAIERLQSLDKKPLISSRPYWVD